MSGEVECPVCGYGPKPEASVIAHMQGKSDDDHSGIGYEKAKQKLKVEETVNGTDNTAPDSGDDSDAVPDSGSSMERPETQEVDEQEEEAIDSSTGPTNSSEGGLGLSGANPFPDQQSSGEAAEQATEQAEGNGEGGGIAVLGALVALGLAALGAVKGRGGSTGGQDEFDVL